LLPERVSIIKKQTIYTNHLIAHNFESRVIVLLVFLRVRPSIVPSDILIIYSLLTVTNMNVAEMYQSRRPLTEWIGASFIAGRVRLRGIAFSIWCDDIRFDEMRLCSRVHDCVA
jgi:hypothetical protein